MNITESNADIVIERNQNERILLFMWKHKGDEHPTPRNIYMIKDDSIVWRVSSNFDDTDNIFTNVWMKDGDIHAYRWDGGEYLINTSNGFATPLRFLK